MKRILLSFLLFPLFASLSWAVTPDTLWVSYSDHGTAMGKEMQTLCKLQVRSASEFPRIAKLNVKLRDNSDFTYKDVVSYLVNSNFTRDLVDYRQDIVKKSLHKPISGASVLELNYRIRRSDLKDAYIYITATINSNATEGSFVSSEILEASLNGKPLVVVSEGESKRKVFLEYQTLFAPGDYGSKNYRIPALLTTREGTVIAVGDKRKYNQTDLPEDIDIVLKRSRDNGKTWSKPILIAEGKGRHKGFGDAAIVETQSGKLLMIFVGGTGLWNSTAEEPIRTYVVESVDDGLTWTAPRDITPQLFGRGCTNAMRNHWRGAFCASGNGCVTKSGRVLFATAVREGEAWSLNNYAIYSDDEGETWHVSGPAMMGGDESKIIELADGKLLMSIRNKSKGPRFYNISHDGGETWATPAQWKELIEPACNGAIMRYQHPSRPDLNILLHSIPFDSKYRRNGSIFISFDEAKTWPKHKVIYAGKTAYTDMAVLPDGNIGFFTEEDDLMSLVFVKISPEYLLSD